MMLADPRLNPAMVVELTEREQLALMSGDDWAYLLDRWFIAEGIEAPQFEDVIEVDLGEET